jgi:6-phosphogluconolactonase
MPSLPIDGHVDNFMPFTILSYPDGKALAKEAAGQWLEELRERAVKSNNTPYSAALSGGRITKDFFQELVTQVRGNSRSFGGVFEGVHFFWADERCVPPTDPESNFAMARELLFEPLKIPEGQIHRLRGEGPEPEALREAVSAICKVAPMSNGQPVVDMIFLGMGENGHIASLFPEESEQEMNDPAIYRAVTTVKPPPRRMTLGYGVIAAAREVRVLISGKGKEEALKQSLSPAATTPLGRVMSLRKQTMIYTDVQTPKV